ncbi:MAG: 3-deoxy-7-phosphoheptulonate synthase [Bacteroidota bacterium]
MKIEKMSDWEFGFPNDGPIIISGPCSAESYDQLLFSCTGVANQGAHILRAGIWKPRTRPNSFEGIGEKALPWLKEAGRITRLPVIIEVATPWHIEAALNHDIDMLWIGTRTTVSPFAMQEIAQVLSGTNIPVFVKNPINPDVNLWLGAIERLSLAGLKQLVAIHRGFNVPDSSPYRNLPMWEIPLRLKEIIPEIELICDPSHICGSRSLLMEVSKKALELGYKGLMIESHIQPEIALSDPSQQVTPEVLGEMINALSPSFSLHYQD